MERERERERKREGEREREKEREREIEREIATNNIKCDKKRSQKVCLISRDLQDANLRIFKLRINQKSSNMVKIY